MKHGAHSLAIASKFRCFCWLLVAVLLGFLPSQGSAQRINTVNSWTAYPSHNSPKHLVKVGDVFYVISKGGLFTYDTKTKATHSYTSVEGMSQIDPTAIHYHAASGKFFVGFN
ncbi:MAG TPA: hypothetical protein VHS96_03450, partial [Bacteroidia bacterium]|nr:hypothetical protein [Bacteroidia bacterium]